MRALMILAAAGAALTVAACAEDYHRDRYAYGAPRHAERYDAYYDGYYGDYSGGRWGDDGYYYYRHGQNQAYYRDDDRHFRRDEYNGFRGVGSASVGVGGLGAGAHVDVGIGGGYR